MTTSTLTFVFADPHTVSHPLSDGLHTVFRNWYWAYYQGWGIVLYWFPDHPHYVPCAHTHLHAAQTLVREEHSLLGDGLSMVQIPQVILPTSRLGSIVRIPDRTGEIWIPGGDDQTTMMTHRIRRLSYDWSMGSMDAEEET